MDLSRSLPFLVMPVMLVLVELGAIVLSLPMQTAGIAAFEDPGSFANPFIFLVLLLIFSALILLLIRFAQRRLLALVIGISIFLTFIYIYAALCAFFFPVSILASLLPFPLAVISSLLLYLYPEWYIIDTLGLLIAAGASAIFGISLEPGPVLLLLVALAVYDAIAVYRTRHMITLAEGVLSLRVPILFVIPKRRDYSFVRDGVGEIKEGSERSAFIIGMGDLIMPAILVASANVYTHGPTLGTISVPALCAMAGSIAGLVFLLRKVSGGTPQAGLPPLNGGTILGFLAGLFLLSLLPAGV